MATSPSRERIGLHHENLTGLSGASVDTSIVIPNRAIIFGVSTLTTTTITGASSYDCGVSGETSKFGGSLEIAEGSNNAGVIGPQAFYSDTQVRLTANSGNFTGDAVKVVLHYFLPIVPQEKESRYWRDSCPWCMPQLMTASSPMPTLAGFGKQEVKYKGCIAPHCGACRDADDRARNRGQVIKSSHSLARCSLGRVCIAQQV